MTIAKDIEEKTVELIAAEYGLGTVRTTELLASDPATIAAHLTTDRGSWFIKRHRLNQTLSALQIEYGLLLRLEGAGFALSNPPRLTTAGAIAFATGGGLWTVHDFVRCDQTFQWTEPSWDAQYCQRSAAALAHFHLCGRYVVGHAAHSLPSSTLSSLPQTLMTALSKAGDRRLDVHRHEHVEKLVDVDLPALLAHIRELEDEKTNCQTIVHGDFHPGNVLFSEGSVRAIIDFDYAHAGNPLLDLGYAMIMFCTEWDSPTKDTTLVKETFKDALLSGYRKGLQRGDDAYAAALLAAADHEQLLNLYARVACYLILSWALQGLDSEQLSLQYDPVLEHALRLLDA